MFDVLFRLESTHIDMPIRLEMLHHAQSPFGNSIHFYDVYSGAGGGKAHSRSASTPYPIRYSIYFAQVTVFHLRYLYFFIGAYENLKAKLTFNVFIVRDSIFDLCALDKG